MVLLQGTSAPARVAPRVGFRPSRLTAFALVLGLVTTALAAFGSWIPSLWGDEAASVLSAERSLPSLFRMLGHVDAVHGTYYLFLHFWIGVFGTSPFAVRFPSSVAVGATVIGVVFLANRLSGPRVAVFSGIVCAILPRIMYSGSEARGYAFSALVAVWLTWLLVELLSRGRMHRILWVLYGVGIALAAYIFLFSLLILVAHAVGVVVYRRDLLRRWLRAVALGGLLALPVIYFGLSERKQDAFLSRRSAATFTSSTVTPWFGNTDFAIVGWILVIAAAVFAVVLWRRRVRSGLPRATRIGLMPIALVWLVAPGAILLSVNVIHAIYSSRYLTFSAPAAALVIGWLLAQITRRWLVGTILAVLVATGLISYQAQRTPYAQNDSDWAANASVIAAHAHPGDAVLFDEGIKPSKRPRLGMRVYPSAYVGLVDVALNRPWYRTNNWRDSTHALDNVANRLDGISTVWLTEYRSPGGTADTYDVSTLTALGYTEVHQYGEHSSVIMEFVPN